MLASRTGILIVGITKADAVELGRGYRQKAIVCGEIGKRAELVICDQGA
jgi:hypothetical protein